MEPGRPTRRTKAERSTKESNRYGGRPADGEPGGTSCNERETSWGGGAHFPIDDTAEDRMTPPAPQVPDKSALTGN